MYMHNCTLSLICRNRHAAEPIWYYHVHSNSTDIKLYMNINHKLNFKKSRLLHIQQKFYTDCFAFRSKWFYYILCRIQCIYCTSIHVTFVCTKLKVISAGKQ